METYSSEYGDTSPARPIAEFSSFVWHLVEEAMHYWHCIPTMKLRNGLRSLEEVAGGAGMWISRQIGKWLGLSSWRAQKWV